MATRRTVDQGPAPEPAAEAPPRQPPTEAEVQHVKAMLDTLFAEQSWPRQRAGAAAVPEPEAQASHRAAIREQVALLREQAAHEVSNACGAGEHERCLGCGCGCHPGKEA